MRSRPQRNNDLLEHGHRDALETSNPFHDLPKLKTLIVMLWKPQTHLCFIFKRRKMQVTFNMQTNLQAKKEELVLNK
jgi:hypothetical protein